MVTLTHINISDGGIPKHSTLHAFVGVDGLRGDRQKNLKYHGGIARAVCIYSEELYAELRSEGIAVHPGDIGENFTTRGLDLRSLAVGDRLEVGGCVVEITQVRVPCRQLNVYAGNLHKTIEGRSGWLARVLVEGNVKPGDALTIVRAKTKAAETRPAVPPTL